MLRHPFQYPSSLKRRESFRVSLTGCSVVGNTERRSGRSWAVGKGPGAVRRDAPGPDARPNTKPCIAKTTNLRPVFDLAQKNPQRRLLRALGSKAVGLVQDQLKLIFNFNYVFLVFETIFVKCRRQGGYGVRYRGWIFTERIAIEALVRAHSPLPESPS